MQISDRVHLIRYEDVCLDTQKAVDFMLDFLDLSKNELVDKFIKQHTHGSFGTKNIPYSTYRDSKSKAFEWRYDIMDKDILEIQQFCVDSMDILGYYPMNNIQENKYNQSYVLMGEKPKEFQYIRL